MNTQEHITSVLQTLLGHLGVKIEQISAEHDDKTGSLRIIVSTPDSALLIGERGTRLLALNHLMKRMVEGKEGDKTPATFLVDVNDYQKKRIDDIRTKAHILAERARYFKSSVEMDPMSSYERMLVHAEFTEVADIKTESTGVGRDRRVVLRYREEN